MKPNSKPTNPIDSMALPGKPLDRKQVIEMADEAQKGPFTPIEQVQFEWKRRIKTGKTALNE
jgi:hypothetical protein